MTSATAMSRPNPRFSMTLRSASFLLMLALVGPALSGATDVLTVGSVTSPAGTIRVPLYVRDTAATRLGVERPAGERIQAIGFRVFFEPAELVGSASFARAGVLSKTPLFESTVQPAGSIGFIGSFAESTNPLALGSDAAVPGNLIGYLLLTTAPGATAGTTITLSLDETVSILSNQTASITETFANNGLSLQSGAVTIAAGSCPPLHSASVSLVGAAGACTAGTGGTASVSSPQADWTYQWGWRSSPGGAITPLPGANSSSYTISGSDFDGPGSRYLVVTVQSSCAPAVVSNELPIAITEAPIATILASGGVFESSTHNYASVSDPGPGAAYAWTISNGTITSGQGTRTIRYTAGASGQVTLGVTVTQNGCSAPATPTADVAIRPRPAGASMFYPITPCRVLDTRYPAGPYGGPAAPAVSERQFTVAGVCGVPTGAKSVVVNVTAVSPATAGFVALFPSDRPWPGTSMLSYRTGHTRAANAVVSLSPDGRLTVKNVGATLHYILDVTGYFQ